MMPLDQTPEYLHWYAETETNFCAHIAALRRDLERTEDHNARQDIEAEIERVSSAYDEFYDIPLCVFSGHSAVTEDVALEYDMLGAPVYQKTTYCRRCGRIL